MTYAQGKTYWSVMYQDAEALGSVPAIQSQTRREAVDARLVVPAAVGAHGDYELTLYENFTHTSTDLCGGYFEGQLHPVMYRAGLTEYPFVYTVE